MRIVYTILLYILTINIIFSSADWWDNNFEFREQIEVTTGSNSPFNGYENYTVQIQLDTTNISLFNSSGNDLKIVYWNGSINRELDKEIIDMGTLNTRVRFGLQENKSSSSTESQDYYIYYSNPAALSSGNNISNVYLWYDDASVDRESEYIQGRVDNTAHGGRWGDSITWNSAGYYDFDNGDNFADSLRPINLIERDIYIEYEEFQTNAYPVDMTSGPITRWIGTGAGGTENSADHFYFYEMGESLIQTGTYNSHDDVSDGRRNNPVVTNGLLGFFPTNVWTRLGLASWGIGPTNIKAYYDNESGGWGGERFSGTHSGAAENTGSGQVGLWVQQDAGRIDNIIIRRYTEPEPSLTVINQTKYNSELTINLDGDITQTFTTFIERNKTKYLNATIMCSDSFLNTCGEVSFVAQFNNSPYVAIPSPGFSSPFYTMSPNPQTCILDGGDSCQVSFEINGTGSPNIAHNLRINLTSNESSITSINSEESQVLITQDPIISFNQSILNLGSIFKNSGDISQNILVTSSIGDNTNIVLTCVSGNCTSITNTFSNGGSINEGVSETISFTCSDLSSGNFSAIFEISSDESTTNNSIIVSCEVQKIFGPVISTLISPIPNTTQVMGQNQTFSISSNISCIGECGNISTYAIIGKPKTGITSNDPGDSGWQIKKDYPNSKSGTYWIQTQEMLAPELIYIDMEFDGGGWMLIGRGREDWSWSDSGRGNQSLIASNPTGNSAFSPVYYSSSFIDDLTNNTDISSLIDGVRIRRAANTLGTTWQEGIWEFSTLTNWDWDFDSGITLSDYKINGTSYGSGTTNDFSPSNTELRTFTTSFTGHNNRQGFSYGSSVCDGSNSPINYLWEYISECNSIPFTQVYIRPQYENLEKGQIISPSSLGLNSSSINPNSQIYLEDESKEINFNINAVGPINSTYNISILSLSSLDIINYSISSTSQIKIVNNIIPEIILITPTNNVKTIYSENISFSATINDDDVSLSCSLYLNSIYNSSKVCFSNQNVSFNMTLKSGFYSWYIQVNDSDSNSINSSQRNITILENSFSRITKSITNTGLNLYLINSSKENLLSITKNESHLDFVSSSLNSGSFSPLYDYLFTIIGVVLMGDILVWDEIFSSNEKKDYSYMLSLNNNSTLLDSFIIVSE